MNEGTTVAGMVLAAGRSIRMGRPKALLSSGPGETFVARAVRVLREGGLSGVLVVGRPDDEALQAELLRIDPAPQFVPNPASDSGQLSSLLAGLDHAAARGAGAVAVLPVDMPQVRSESVAALLEAFHRSALPIVRAAHRGRHGHPVIFGRAVFGELRSADPGSGARVVIHVDPGRVLNVEVDDPGVLRDVDLPAEYSAMFENHD